MMAKFITVGGQAFVIEACYRCKTPFAMSREVYDLAQQRNGQFQFFCPNGHGQVYTLGETEEQKLRRERDRLMQSIAFEQDIRRQESERADRAERRASAYKGQTTRLRNRAKAGMCPCCNRHFENLERHMHGQHPEFTAEPDEVEA